VRHGVATIAFPAISCGIYGYPVEKACSIAIDTTLDFLENDDSINMVTFILFSCRHYDVYMEYFNTIKNRFTGL
jgi:O-acetyl-ADP-ribose deacetylase (regulator of RNase III)